MRIAVLANTTKSDSGWGRMSRELILALRRKGVTVSVFAEEGGGLPDDKVILDNSLRFSLYNFWRTWLHIPMLLRNALRIRSRMERVDLVHAFDGYPYSVIAAIALFGKRIPLVATLVGTYSLDAFHHFAERKLMTWALNRSKAITAISNYTADEVRRFVPQFAIEPIGLGTTPSAFADKKVPYVSRIKQPYIISVGAVKPQKGHSVSLRAFAQVKKLHPELSLVIVGFQKDRYFQEVTELVRTLGIAGSVHFYSSLPDQELIDIYDGAEYFVLTPVQIGSLFEGFGLVYREAGARGLASIGSLHSGADDAVKDGVTGILCPQGDVEAVCRAMEILLTDAPMRARMGEAGRRLAHEWTWDRVAEEYIRIYEQILLPRSVGP